MNTDPLERIALIDARAAEIGEELRPLRHAMNAARSSVTAAPEAEDEAKALRAELRRLSGLLWLRRADRGQVDQVKAALHAAETKSEALAAEAAAQRELGEIGSAAIAEMIEPLETETNRLASHRELAERQHIRARAEVLAVAYRSKLAAVGEVVAELAAHAAVLNRLERIDTANPTPIGERQSFGRVFGAVIADLPAWPTLVALKACEYGVRITLDPKQAAAGDVVIDGPSITARVQAELDRELRVPRN